MCALFVCTLLHHTAKKAKQYLRFEKENAHEGRGEASGLAHRRSCGGAVSDGNSGTSAAYLAGSKSGGTSGAGEHDGATGADGNKMHRNSRRVVAARASKLARAEASAYADVQVGILMMNRYTSADSSPADR